MVTSRHPLQRLLHTVVSGMCGLDNSCRYDMNGIQKWKIDYRSQPSAERAALQLSGKFRRNFDVYQCWWCRGWHVGNAHKLTVKKFGAILWFWIIQKKRTGSKPRTHA